MRFLGKMVAGTLIVLVTLTIVVVGCSAAATAAPKAATGRTTFTYPGLVSTFMVKYLNEDPDFSNVRTASANRYRIVLKGRYEYQYNFTAHLTKAGRQTVRVTLYMMGTHLSDTYDLGMDV